MKAAAILLALALFTACGVPLPPEKSEYAGTWKGEKMHLAIYSAGRVSYKRRKGNSNTKIDAPILRYEGDDFVVGFWKFETTFIVQRPPERTSDAWTMTVDGVRLHRTSKMPLKAPDDRLR